MYAKLGQLMSCFILPAHLEVLRVPSVMPRPLPLILARGQTKVLSSLLLHLQGLMPLMQILSIPISWVSEASTVACIRLPLVTTTSPAVSRTVLGPTGRAATPLRAASHSSTETFGTSLSVPASAVIT